MKIKKMKPCTITPDAVPAHLYFFSPDTLEAFMKKGGFSTFKKQSGNYGAVRRHIKPVPLNVGPFYERLARFIYFRTGLQQLLYRSARIIGKGNGLIMYARFHQ